MHEVVKKVAAPFIKRLPQNLNVLARILRAMLQGKIKFVLARNRLPRDTFEVKFSDNLQTIKARCGFHGWMLEHEQSPALAYHSATGVLKNLNVLSPGLIDPKAYLFTFRGVEIQYVTGSDVWPPSFISFILAAKLIDSWQQSDQRIWDVGCGAGIIGLNLKRLTACREAHLTDSDPKAIELARANAERMGMPGLTFGVEAFPPSEQPIMSYDLLVSNPPWFPPEFVISEGFKHPFLDDLPLMKALLYIGPYWAKRVVFGFPGIMLEEITSHLLKLDSLGTKWRLLDQRRLPLPWRVIGDERLRELPSGLFREGPSAEFDLWHDFYIYELRWDGSR